MCDCPQNSVLQILGYKNVLVMSQYPSDYKVVINKVTVQFKLNPT